MSLLLFNVMRSFEERDSHCVRSRATFLDRHTKKFKVSNKCHDGFSTFMTDLESNTRTDDQGCTATKIWCNVDFTLPRFKLQNETLVEKV